MNVTHAAVSQQVRKLEKNLGVQLVIKKNGVVTLTEAGQELAYGLEFGFQQLNSSVQATLNRAGREAITVTMTPSFATEWMSPRIAKFKNAFPLLDLIISPSFKSIDMKSSQVDLGIRFGNGKWSNVTAYPWCRTPLVVVVATKLVAGISDLSLLNLPSIPWLQELGTTEVEDWAKNTGYPMNSDPKLVFLPGHMILPAMREGGGIACTAKMLVQEEIDNGSVTILYSNDGNDRSLGYYLVTPDKTTKPTLKKVVDWFDVQL